MKKSIQVRHPSVNHQRASPTAVVLTRRHGWLPAVKGKATAVIGVRRCGKTGLPLPAGVRRHRAADGLLSSGDGPSHGPSQK